MIKQPLGRGLDSLIPRGAPVQNPAGGAGGLLEIDLTEIIPNDNQPRKIFDSELLNELAESIKEKGVIQPVILTKVEGLDKYMIIEGERRWRASGLAGKKTIPAILRKSETPKERLELALITNAQREDLNPVELAHAYSKLMDEYGYRQEDLGAIMGRSRSAVANRLRLLTLPQEVLEALQAKLITEGHARTILSIGDKGAQMIFLKEIIDKSLSVRDAEKLVKKFKDGIPQKAVAKPVADKSHMTGIVSEIESFFKSKVNIKEKEKGGVIEIKYNSDDELDTIIKKIRGEVC